MVLSMSDILFFMIGLYGFGVMLMLRLAVTEWAFRSGLGFFGTVITCLFHAIFWPMFAYEAVAEWYRNMSEKPYD